MVRNNFIVGLKKIIRREMNSINQSIITSKVKFELTIPFWGLTFLRNRHPKRLILFIYCFKWVGRGRSFGTTDLDRQPRKQKQV